MIFVSHRGNLSGPNPLLENTKEYIISALKKGFPVECDIWYEGDRYFLGHDKPTKQVKKDFLTLKGLWIHCKTIETFENLLKKVSICFFHESDPCTLVSNKIIWSFPCTTTVKNTLIIKPEEVYGIKRLPFNCYGLCSDFVEDFKREYDK